LKILDEGVSIILPVHGEALYLSEALRSIAIQEHDLDYEVVLALDRPGQTTLDAISRFSHPKMRTVPVKEGGVANAHNTALFSARFNLVAVMHSDDVMLKHRIGDQARFMKANPETVCVGGQIEIIDEEGVTIGFSWFPEKEALVRASSRFRTPVAHPTAMFRTAIATHVGGYLQSSAPAEDYDLWLRMMDHGSIRNLSSLVLQYRRHQHQTSQFQKELQSIQFASITSRTDRIRRGLASSNVEKSNLWRRQVRLDAALHQLARDRFSRRWNRIFPNLIEVMKASPVGFFVYASLYLFGRYRLLRIRNAQ
jgi:glycosyltransferase involved in cell wall biosynthesis